MNHLKTLKTIQTPAYVADIAAIKRNMAVAERIKQEVGVKILLATKAFSMFSVFPFMKDTLDGTTASGLYEARLGATHFGPGEGKDVHTYAPAFTEEDLRTCLEYSNHIYFNSISQLNRFSKLVRQERPDAKIGLRVNPGLSLVKNSALYDPSSPCSRFGVQAHELSDEILEKIDILHFHNLCENMAEDSVTLINHISQNFGHALRTVSEVNLGGGHYITHANYDVNRLINSLKEFQQILDIKVTLEPGGALVYNAGYLVSTVLDIIENEKKIAIIDASASTHMPDVLEVPYRPHIIDSGEAKEKPHNYLLGGNTCMTGDIIGEYSFDTPLSIGDTLIFTDMMQYSFVKNTTFNGVPLPDISILHEDGRYELVKRFSYNDFEARLS
ncbi:MAG: carboxynorspermidine decarboxylase [Micavibrio sp.]|nr:carboxynorspermidine decarboxylase [Micavibrio sp.]|tara:strand:- start:612 stop:1769 length:1158 start_codon:yes stop_codon:yes gene_type:complete